MWKMIIEYFLLCFLTWKEIFRHYCYCFILTSARIFTPFVRVLDGVNHVE